MSNQKRAVVYARSATVQDAEAQFPRETQVKACTEYALEHGYEVVKVFSEAFSGIQYRERPGLSQIRRMAQDHDFDVLLINTYDRLSRSQVHLTILLDEFESQGICVECVQEKMDTTPTGRFLQDAFKLLAQTKKGHEISAQRKRAAIYARTATVQELGPNFAMAEQIHQCKAYGFIQGYEVVEEFQEVGSGSSIDRPVLKSILEAAKDGKFDAVIIRSYDRLSRKQEKAAVILATLEGYGVRVFSVSEDVLPGEIDAAMQRMITALHAEADRIEKEKIASRARAGREAKKQAQEGK